MLPVATRGINEASFYATENINSKSQKDRLTCKKREVRWPRLAPREMQTSVDRLITEAASLYGYANLKDEQKKVLKSFVEGKDVFVAPFNSCLFFVDR